MAYGENLGADCGGGSSTSNNLLLLHQMNSADLFAINAEHDESLEVSRHAKGLSAGFLVACEMVESPNFDRASVKMKRLERGVAGKPIFDRSLFDNPQTHPFTASRIFLVFLPCSVSTDGRFAVDPIL